MTTAAALLAVNFFAFGTGGGTVIQMFGIGTGVAILMDATLVRGVLVPAGMQVLGRAAWVGAASTASAPRPVGLREAPGAQPIADGRRT